MKKKYPLIIIYAIFMYQCFFYLSSFAQSEIVNPKQVYTYWIMADDIKLLSETYSGLVNYKVIGKSEYGLDIYAVSLGKGSATIFINAAHHAREWMGTTLSMYEIEQYAKTYTANQMFGKYNIRNILENVTLWFVPMINPDGVTLQQSGLKSFPVKDHQALINMNNGSNNFKRWKSNIKGIDLNRQYSINWEYINNNFKRPSWSEYKGDVPEKTLETKALISFVDEIKPELSINYHTSGEVIYWMTGHSKELSDYDYSIAREFSKLTGYKLIDEKNSAKPTGMLPWFVNKYSAISFTPELGKYVHETNVPLSQFTEIWNKNKYGPLLCAEAGYKYYLMKNKINEIKQIKVIVNGEDIKFDQAPTIKNDRVLVPLRSIAEFMGNKITWYADTRAIVIEKNDKNLVKLSINESVVDNNGTLIQIDVAPQIIGSRTFVPLRFVAEILGAAVDWNNESRTVNITQR